MRTLPLLALALFHCTTPETASTSPGSDPLSCEPQPVAEPIPAQEATVNGSAFLYAPAEDSRGLALLFHGGNGEKEDYTTARVEAVLVTQALLDDGYTVAALDSVAHLDPHAKKTAWSEDDTTENPDIVNVMAMIERLTDPADLDAAPSGPVIAIGASNGGSMASRVVQHVDVHATAIYISNAQAFWNDGARFAPMLLMPGENDPGHALESNADLAEIVAATGTPVTYLPNIAEPVTPGNFTRIAGIGCEDSQTIQQRLIEVGLLDAAGTVLYDPSDFGWHDPLETDYGDWIRLINDVLTEAYAGHAVSADLNDDLLHFLEANGA